MTGGPASYAGSVAHEGAPEHHHAEILQYHGTEMGELAVGTVEAVSIPSLSSSLSLG